MLYLKLGAETYLPYAERFRLSSYCRFRNPKPETDAEIRNQCRNPKLLPKPETSDEIQNWSVKTHYHIMK